MTTLASNARTTLTPTSSKVTVPSVKLSSARIAASAPSRASPAGLAWPSARPRIASPGAHSRVTSHVTRPDGERASEKPVKRNRSRRTTTASARAWPCALSLDIADISVWDLKIRERMAERRRPVLVYEPNHKKQPMSTTNRPSTSLDRTVNTLEGGHTVTDVTRGVCSVGGLLAER